MDGDLAAVCDRTSEAQVVQREKNIHVFSLFFSGLFFSLCVSGTIGLHSPVARIVEHVT